MNYKRVLANKKILITGGGGYIGTIATNYLIKKGYQVKILDTLYWGTTPLESFSTKIELVRLDIRDIGSQVLKKVDSVIHAAGLSNDPMANFNPKANMEINFKATINLAKLCKKNGVARFIFASSASIYDKGLSNPVLIQNESAKVNPTAAYSLSKYKAEKSLLELTDKSFSPIIIRQGTVFGFSPRMRYDLVVNTMVKDALAKNKLSVFCDGQEWRPLVDVSDVAKSYALFLEAPQNKVSGQIFNLVFKNYNILALAKLIKRTLKELKLAEPKIEMHDRVKKGRSYRISGEKLESALNWHPVVSVESSIKKMAVKMMTYPFSDYNHPKYYNIEWMRLLIETQDILSTAKRVF